MRTQARHTDIQYLVENHNYQQLYARLVQLLPKELSSLFAKVQLSSKESIWNADQGNYLPYTECDQSLQEEISNWLAERESQVREYLAADKEMGPIIDQLLQIPDESCIWAAIDGKEVKAVTLAKWACREVNHPLEINPVKQIVNRSKSNFTEVTIQLHFNDGSLASNMPFVFEYRDISEHFDTDEEGQKPLGKLRNGSVFIISDQQYPDNRTEVVVGSGQSLYNITLKRYTKVDLSVVDQLETPVPNYPLYLSTEEAKLHRSTDGNGKLQLDRVLLSAEGLRVSSAYQPDLSSTYTLNAGQNFLTFSTEQQIRREPIIELRNDQGAAIPDYDIQIEYAGKQFVDTSDEKGEIRIEGLEVPCDIAVTDVQNRYNNHQFRVTYDTFRFQFQVNPPFSGDVSITFLDHKRKPVPEAAIDVAAKKESFKRITNREGRIYVPFAALENQEKVSVSGRFKNGDKTLRIRKRTFKFDASRQEYVIRLWTIDWRWLLLLLLPLFGLLLMPFNKDLQVQTIMTETQMPVDEVEVTFAYQYFTLYDKGNFWVNESIKKNAVSDSSGMVLFRNLPYTPLSYVFRYFSRTSIHVDTYCFRSDTIRPLYHPWHPKDTVQIEVNATLIDLDFLVIDSEEKQVLPGSEVRFGANFRGQKFKAKKTTDARGRILFRDIPQCGMIEEVSAVLEGYFEDEFTEVPIEQMLGDLDRRTLELRPIKESIVFYVTNCKTGEYLPDAIATLNISKYASSIDKTAYTNTKGMGRATYEETHVLSKLKIAVKKKYFESAVWAGSFTVGEFVRLPEEQRTICLEPLENPITFQNVDSISGLPIEGVQNFVSIARGGVIEHDTLTSNLNGYFTIAGLNFGDEVSIRSNFDPDYLPNFHKVRKKDAIALLEGSNDNRVIPLSPKLISATFRTVDTTQRPPVLVPDVGLEIYINGKQTNQPSNSGLGEFLVEAPATARVSVVAEKDGYQINDQTIRNDVFGKLKRSGTFRRDIPMNWFLPCDQPSSSGDGDSGEMVFTLGSENGQVNLTYNMFGHPDRLIIFCGRDTSGPVLFDQTIKDGEGSPFLLTYDADMCEGFLTAVVIPTEDDQSSAWEFTLSCP